MRLPVILRGMIRTYTSRAPPAHGRMSVCCSRRRTSASLRTRTAPDTLLAGYLDGPAGFEVDRLDEALSQGWSVLVTGRAARVTSEADVRRLEQQTDIRPWAGGARDVYVRIIPRKITGRRIRG